MLEMVSLCSSSPPVVGLVVRLPRNELLQRSVEAEVKHDSEAVLLPR